MSSKIQLRRGQLSDIPALDNGEPGFVEDTTELYIGTPSGNKKLTFDADKHAELESQLAENEQQIKIVPSRGLPNFLKRPTEMPTFPIQLRIRKNIGGMFEVLNFDIESFHPVKNGKAYYVAIDGVNTNDGLTRQTAFRSLSKALTMVDVDVIYIAGGEYGRQHNYGQILPDRDIKIKAYNNENVVIGCYENVGQVWTQHATGVYKFTRASTVNVYDTKILNEYGNYTRYIKKTALADVVSTPGTWFLDSADNMLYVHTLDDRQPQSDTDIKVEISGRTLEGNKLRNYYFEGIKFEMGFTALKINGAKMALFKDCEFAYSFNDNGLSILDTETILSHNCKAYENYLDGFNYHADTWTTKYLYFLEVNNIGFRNGFSGNTISNNNGSTSHPNCVGIRVNGLYFENNGPNVPDVGTRNFTWDIGCTAYDSKMKDSQGNSTPMDFLTENKKWLDSCIAYGSKYSLYEQTTDGTFYTRNCILNGDKIGTVVNY